jgi:hypothetical protein
MNYEYRICEGGDEDRQVANIVTYTPLPHIAVGNNLLIGGQEDGRKAGHHLHIVAIESYIDAPKGKPERMVTIVFGMDRDRAVMFDAMR